MSPLAGQTSDLMPAEGLIPDGRSPAREFRTTHWSVVLRARNSGDPGAAEALEQLCRDYWYPLYAFIRSSGHNSQDAQDFTQEFLSLLIERRRLDAVGPERGRFRSYLLATLKNFLNDQRKRARAQKRGGGREIVSIDEARAESRFALEPMDTHSPDVLFEREWGLAVLDRAMSLLRERYSKRGRTGWFDQLRPFLGGAETPPSQGKVAAALGADEGTIKVAVHRLRKEFGLILREEIGRTVEDPSEVDAEIRQLIRVTSGQANDFR